MQTMRRTIRGSLAVVWLVVGISAGTFLAGPLLEGQAPPVRVIPKELSSYRDVVKQVLPAVVSIEARAKPTPKAKKPAQRRRLPDNADIPEEFRKFFEEFERRPFEMPDTPEMG